MSPDPMKEAVTEVQPVQVAVIGGTGTGDGGTLQSGTVTTPGAQPNIVVTIISPLMAILVRFVNNYLTTLVGLVGAGMTPLGNDILPREFGALVGICAQLSFAGAAFGSLKDIVTIFGRLEGKYPLLTGGV